MDLQETAQMDHRVEEGRAEVVEDLTDIEAEGHSQMTRETGFLCYFPTL